MDPVRASYDTVARRYADEIAGELVNKPVDRALYTLFADRQRWPDGARQASEDARAKVAGAGVPDVKDGGAIAERFVNALAAVRDAYGKAHDTVHGLPDATFYAGVAQAMATLNQEYGKAGLDTVKV